MNAFESKKEALPSYFRFILLMCFDLFHRNQVNAAVVEVGIGGRFDATNVIDHPVACGITLVSLEHQDVLGQSIEDIAWHKAGIIKQQILTFTVPQSASVHEILEKEAALKDSHIRISSVKPDADSLGIGGSHQASNAALALDLSKTLLERLGSSFVEEKALQALQSTKWPGRCQKLKRVWRNKEINFFIDGAHTVESIIACRDWFNSCNTSGERNVLIFAITGNRDYRALMEPLFGLFDTVIFSKPQSSKGTEIAKKAEIADLRSQMKVFLDSSAPDTESILTDTVEDALDICSHSSSNVLVTGSLYLVGAVLDAMDVDVP